MNKQTIQGSPIAGGKIIGTKAADKYQLTPQELIDIIKENLNKGLTVVTRLNKKIVDAEKCSVEVKKSRQIIYNNPRGGGLSGRGQYGFSLTENNIRHENIEEKYIKAPEGCVPVNFMRIPKDFLDTVYIVEEELKKILLGDSNKEEQNKGLQRKYNNALLIIAGLICEGGDLAALEARGLAGTISKRIDEFGLSLGETTIRDRLKEASEMIKQKNKILN
jgi:hypothetical protein